MKLLETETAYALWAESYPPRAHNELMRAEQESMKTFLRSIPVTRALDLGTGTGRYLRLLRESGASEVIGLDRSEAMLERARAAGAPLVHADALALPLAGEAFDLVLSSLMVGDVGVPGLSVWTREVGRILRRGGSLLYSDFHPSWRDNGWERTFQSADGRWWRLPIHPHALEDHRNALAGAGLRLLEVREPRWKGRPVALVLHARK